VTHRHTDSNTDIPTVIHRHTDSDTQMPLQTKAALHSPVGVHCTNGALQLNTAINDDAPQHIHVTKPHWRSRRSSHGRQSAISVHWSHLAS